MSKEAVERFERGSVLLNHFGDGIHAAMWNSQNHSFNVPIAAEAAIREDAVREWREAVQEWVEYERADAHRDLGGRCDQDAQPWPCPAFTLRALLDREKDE